MTQPAIKEAGGEYLAGGMNKTTMFDGMKPPSRVVIIRIIAAASALLDLDG